MSKKIEAIQKDILKIETWINKKNQTLEKKLKISNKAGYLLNHTLENILKMDDELLYVELRLANENNEKQSVIDSLYSIVMAIEDYEIKLRKLNGLYKMQAELIQEKDSMTVEQKEEKEKINSKKELSSYIKNEIDSINIPSLEKWLKEYKEAYIASCNQHLNGRALTIALADANKVVRDQKIKIITRTFEKVGKIVDVSFGNIGLDGSFNGVVTGENGLANIETILAGGYNIQKLHYRVLVK